MFGKKRKKIQAIADKYCEKAGIKKIKILFEAVEGEYGRYVCKYENGVWTPLYIKIYWGPVCKKKETDKEIIYILAHELAHHELNVKRGNRTHCQAFNNLWKEIEVFILGLYFE